MRVKSPRHRRHKKLLKQARGYRMTRHRLYKVAHEAVVHAGQYAYAGRKRRKRDLRSTWITRTNAALRSLGISYSRFMAALKTHHIQLNRQILADLAARQPETFKEIAKTAGFNISK